ncbi:MAG: SDR family NAD(P)-dependent oxidoreductase, partial [Acidobacteria bacterium]|nr:SDR family NAD(P)-dependent oxidoreductase [Acidobacteriota bacterium]
MGEFEGRVVIVTGGGIGLGKAFSRGFAGAGAQVVVADIAEAEAKTIAEEINGLAVRVDVSSESDTQAMAKAAHDKYGRIDVLINNASLWTALLPMKPWTEITVEEWDRVMAVNVKGYFL